MSSYATVPTSSIGSSLKLSPLCLNMSEMVLQHCESHMNSPLLSETQIGLQMKYHLFNYELKSRRGIIDPNLSSGYLCELVHPNSLSSGYFLEMVMEFLYNNCYDLHEEVISFYVGEIYGKEYDAYCADKQMENVIDLVTKERRDHERRTGVSSSIYLKTSPFITIRYSTLSSNSYYDFKKKQEIDLP